MAQAEYSYHNTTVPGTWQELELTGVVEIAERSPVEIVNRSATEMLWYSWNYPDGTYVDPDTMEIGIDGSFVVLPMSKMVIAPQHFVNQFIFTSEANPVDYSVHVVW